MSLLLFSWASRTPAALLCKPAAEAAQAVHKAMALRLAVSLEELSIRFAATVRCSVVREPAEPMQPPLPGTLPGAAKHGGSPWKDIAVGGAARPRGGSAVSLDTSSLMGAAGPNTPCSAPYTACKM
jgi:hypothetical protein